MPDTLCRETTLLVVVACASGLGTGCMAADDIAGDDGDASMTVGQPAHAQTRPPGPTPEQIALKAGLRRPPTGVRSTTFVAKPGREDAVRATPAVAWSVGLAASPPSTWPTDATTLTATANMDVGPTPYYIRILDFDSNVFIATCGAGTTCQVSVTRPIIQTSSFAAFVEDLQGNEVADSMGGFLFGALPVSWHGSGVRLTESATTVPIGGTATLFASTSFDIGPSPFYAGVYDVTTGAILAQYGFGTGITASVSQSTATTHEYRACFSSFGTSYPPPNMLECGAAQYVTWSNSGNTVSLAAPSTTFDDELVTATASLDVGPTPYFIQIYSIEDGRLASCGAGTTCTAAFTPSMSGSHVVAFIAQSSASLPPPLATAESAIVETTRVEEPPR
jgi:hypothetical protein